MAIFKKSLPLAVSLVIASSFAGADQLEETVVVADRVETAVESLAVSVNVMDRELISALGSATLPQLYVPKLASQQRKRAVLARSVAFVSEDKMASELVY